MRAAARMIGQTLTMPIGIAHEGVHSFAAALCGCEASIHVRPNGSHCRVDFEPASDTQRALVALAPTLVALMVSPAVWWVLSESGIVTALVAFSAIALFGFPSEADRTLAARSLRERSHSDARPTVR